MIAYKLTGLNGKDYVVKGVVRSGELLLAKMPENGDVPIYSIRYDNEFKRYYKDHIKDNEDLRDGGQGDTEGPSRRPSRFQVRPHTG